VAGYREFSWEKEAAACAWNFDFIYNLHRFHAKIGLAFGDSWVHISISFEMNRNHHSKTVMPSPRRFRIKRKGPDY
jgi:hypothetical protein